MATTDLFRLGADVWLECELQPGPGGERSVYLKVGDAEWLGFVSAADIKENGRAFVRATVIGQGDRGIVVQPRGNSIGPGAIQAPPDAFQRHGALPT